MEYSAAEKAIVWLAAHSGLDYRARVAFLRSLKDPALVFTDEVLLPKDGKTRLHEADALVKSLEKHNRFALTLLAEDYPEPLKHIHEPPLVLFGEGRRELLKRRKFCIVGSRVTPPWAEKCGRQISERLSDKFCIVTGLAEGGDRAAVDGALAGGNLICVLPCGLDVCYPAAHSTLKERIAKRGLLLSEYAPDEGVTRYAFHARNRILAGLSEGVLVLSAGARSGTLITANCAVDYGRDVFALPHNVGVSKGEGCNELIKRGAYLVTDVEDILAVYGMTENGAPMPELTDEEARVMQVLSEGELHAAVIADRAGMRIFEASAVLSALEIKGLAVKSGGNRYSAVSSVK